MNIDTNKSTVAGLFISLIFQAAAYGADVEGTDGNNILFFQSVEQHINMTITNPYSGESIFIDEPKYLNQSSYDGKLGIDTLLMTNRGDALFLEDPVGVRWVWNIERFLAGAGGDILHLASATFALGDIYIVGGAGDDVIWSNSGNDEINGQGGDDRINAGPGDDTVFGGDHNDEILGGEGQDYIYPEGGADTVDAGPGDDTVFEEFSTETDLITGGLGIDTVNMQGVSESYVSITPSSDAAYELDLTSLNPTYPGVIARLRGVEFAEFTEGLVDLSAFLIPMFDCIGFEPPFSGPLVIKYRSRKTIPVIVRLYDQDGYLQTDIEITAPVINVWYNGTVVGSNPPDDEDLLSNGSANDGNYMRYYPVSQAWIYNLGTAQFSQPGSYEVSIRSGNNEEYVIANHGSCTEIFTRLP